MASKLLAIGLQPHSDGLKAMASNLLAMASFLDISSNVYLIRFTDFVSKLFVDLSLTV